jgi:hypothetical protein
MENFLQTYFNEFHEKIKLIDTSENAQLRDKRDLLLDELRAHLKRKSENEKKKLITFQSENQGSYSMGIGIKPIGDIDYDIDVMLLFNISKDENTPTEVKKWVLEALDKSPRTVEYKKSCVRVQYYEKGEIAYHVDLACYASSNIDGYIYLSKGKQTSKPEEIKWELSEPKELKNKINNKYSNSEERQQFKRVIRYLKRWKDFKFQNTIDGKPTGVAITAIAYNGFMPYFNTDSFSSEKKPNDFIATRNLIQYFIDQFDWFDNITVKLPVLPYNDLFEKMKKYLNQTKILKNKLKNAIESFDKAESETDPVEACKILQMEFGEDFPVPDKNDTGQKRIKAVASSPDQAKIIWKKN